MIDVIVPVYRGLGETRRCVESVLANAQRTPFELVVIDDASPEPAICAWLDELAAAGRITLLRNDANLGFVQSVNRGMSMHPDRDVVLLNSDTEVANDWLDRLAACAAGAPDIASVTPFSNNATICSYPFEGWKNGVPGTLGLAALDRLFAQVNAGTRIEIPTAVGFCMLLRRSALDRVGLFDAERYGRGYGEENDFCMRAAKAGLRHVLAADVFVFHEGSVSFADDRFALMDKAAHVLVKAHPEYPRLVRSFIISDPAHPPRARVDAARVARGAQEAACVLGERALERANLVHGIWDLDRKTSERDNKIGELHLGLVNARHLIADREKTIAELQGEIGRLRAGLAHAESLAFSRADELERIRALWPIRVLRYVQRRRSRGTPTP